MGVEGCPGTIQDAHYITEVKREKAPLPQLPKPPHPAKLGPKADIRAEIDKLKAEAGKVKTEAAKAKAAAAKHAKDPPVSCATAVASDTRRSCSFYDELVGHACVSTVHVLRILHADFD